MKTQVIIHCPRNIMYCFVLRSHEYVRPQLLTLPPHLSQEPHATEIRFYIIISNAKLNCLV